MNNWFSQISIPTNNIYLYKIIRKNRAVQLNVIVLEDKVTSQFLNESFPW